MQRTLKSGVEFTDEWLREQEEKNLKEAEIANLLGISRMALFDLRKRFNLPKRFKRRGDKPKLTAEEKRKNYNDYQREYQRDRPKYKMISVDGRIVSEHRHIMENHIGRRLRPTEVVHHKDNDILNNHIDNLELIDNQGRHIREHHADRAGRKAKLWEYDGQWKTIDEWAFLYDLNPKSLRSRLELLRWSIEDALLIPTGKYRNLRLQKT